MYAKIALDTGEYESGINKALGHTDSLVSKLGSGLKKIGKVAATAMGAATTAVGAFVKSAVDVGTEFDATMSEVSAISGATGTDFDALREKALEMGATTKFSANEAAQAFTYMAMAGWKSGDMIDGIAGIMDLAAASGEDLALTSDIVTDALTAFGMTAADSGHFADVLAAASSNANTNVALLGDSFRYVAPIAGTFGYSAEDTAVALGLMANSGIKASQAGTALRAALSSMIKPTDPTAAAMKSLGLWIDGTTVAMVNQDGTSKSLLETMGILRRAFSELTEAEKAEYAAQIFGREAMSGMLAIINASEHEFGKLTTAIYHAEGAAQQMASTMQDNLAGDIEEFGGALETLQIIVSDKLKPTLREFVQFGTRAIETLSTAFQDGGLHGAMDALGTVLSEGLNMVIAKTPAMIDAGMQLLGALGQGLMNNLPAIITAAETVMWQMVDGLIIALPALAEGAAQIIVGLSQRLVENLPKLQQAAEAVIPALVEAIKVAAPALIDAAIAIIDVLAAELANQLPLLLEAGASILGNLIAGITSSLPAFLLSIRPVMDGIGGIIKTVSSVKDVVKTVLDAVGIKLTGVIDIVGKLKGGLSALWGVLAANPIAIIIAAVAGLVAALIGLWNTNEDFRAAVTEIWENIKEAFVNAWEAIKGAWDKAVEFFSGIGEGIHSAFEAVTTALTEFFTAAWETVKGAWDAAKGFFSDIGEGIRETFSEVKTAISERFSEGWSAVKSAWDGATGFFSEKWEGIKNVFSNVGDWFKNIGSNIVDGLKTGIRNAWESFTGWLDDKVGGIINGVKSMLGIASPSKVFAGIGENMALGLSVGWEKEYDSIKSRIEDGMAFQPAHVDVEASTLYTARHQSGDIAGAGAGRGGDTFNFYSPKALDPVSAAREMKKAKQQMALGYV